ncbi:hypothetical protein M948_02985 [Virgibacillus sp. CM-4]|nr:hypothetical protein M948_02985 [Virgibacillus sp. CM-4]
MLCTRSSLHQVFQLCCLKARFRQQSKLKLKEQ